MVALVVTETDRRQYSSADTPEEYWRRSVYYPLLDHIPNELEPETGLWELQVLSRVHWQCGRATDSILIVASIHLLPTSCPRFAR
jgi:hypothetical protein